MIKKRVFKTKVFSRLISKKIIPDQDILKAVNEMENGLYDADLGGNVYKKRIAVGNRGKKIMEHVRLLQHDLINIGILYLALKRTNVIT